MTLKTFKKAAMFGLESRALKKQFGKLFLVRMQSVDSKETRGARIQSNRAAMFGLDARIALAIFGALSVISGAALYSAIQQSRATALLANVQEFAKAYEQFVLDTGQDVPISSGGVYREVEFLIDKTGFSGSGWNGPYIGYKDTGSAGSTGRIVYSDGSSNIKWLVVPYESIDWSDPTAAAQCDAAGTPCFNWIVREGSLTKELVEAIDQEIDGSIDHAKGNVRIKTWPGPDYSLYVKVMPTLNSPLK